MGGRKNEIEREEKKRERERESDKYDRQCDEK